jgi:hypothetical protein
VKVISNPVAPSTATGANRRGIVVMDYKLEVVVVSELVSHGTDVSEVFHDADWPSWYAQYMVDEQAGHPAGAGQGASR